MAAFMAKYRQKYKLQSCYALLPLSLRFMQQRPRIGGSQAIKSVCDALADAALAHDATGLPEARALMNSATHALREMGDQAVPHVRRFSQDDRPAVKQAFAAVFDVARSKKWWKL